MREIKFSRTAKKDAKTIPRERRDEIVCDLTQLARGERNNLDIVPIEALKKDWRGPSVCIGMRQPLITLTVIKG